MKIGLATLGLAMALGACGGTVTSTPTDGTTAAAVNAETAKAEAPPSRPAPPAVAFDACARAAVGDACAFTDEHGSHAGSCILPPDAPDDRMVCRPNDAPKCDR